MRHLALLLLLCACDRPQAPVRVEVEPPSPPPGAAAPSEPPPREPYAIRFVRPCFEWGTRDLLGTDRHVFGCDGAVWDRASGALVAIADPEDGMPIASIGARSLWISLMGRLRIAGEDGRVGEAIDVPYDYDVVASRDGAFAWVGRWSLVDLRGRTVRALRDRCAGAIALGFAGDGAPQCLVRCGDRSCLRSIDAGSETDLPALASASFSPQGTLLAFSEGAALRIDGGRVVDRREAPPHAEVLAWSSEGDAIVASEGRAALWHPDGTREQLFGGRVERASFAGDEILLATASNEILWLARGARWAPPELSPATPPGARALAPTEDEGAPSFEGWYPRGVADVAAFARRERPRAQAVVSRVDGAELGRALDDAWPRLAAGRYVSVGTERWAKWWRDEDGRRVLRGHAYIGGCERTHVDVLLRETADGLERWLVHAARAGDARVMIPDPPAGARDVAGLAQGYGGDPSIGRVE